MIELIETAVCHECGSEIENWRYVEETGEILCDECYKLIYSCPRCKGTGRAESIGDHLEFFHKCEWCDGKGTIPRESVRNRMGLE